MFLHLANNLWHLKSLIVRLNAIEPDKHLFYIFDQDPSCEEFKNVVFYPLNKLALNNLIEELSLFDGVFIHDLTYQKAKIILKSPREIRFVWVMWGYDYYYIFPRLLSSVFLPYTKLINALLFKFSLTLNHGLYYVNHFTTQIGLKTSIGILNEAISRIKYFCNNLDELSDLFKVIPLDKKNSFGGIYFSVESLAKGIDVENLKLKNGILVGNSSSNSSNHLDLFLSLRRISKKKPIIVPLSYGSKRYQKLISFLGQLCFGNYFFPIKTFLTPSEYNHQLMECNVMIYNHRRAQGVGNIILGLYMGHKIFLRKENPLYGYLTKLGIKLFTINFDLNDDNLSCLEPDLIKHNRMVLMKYYSEDKIRQNIMNITQALKLPEKQINFC